MPESLELSFLFTTFAHKDTYNMKEDKPYILNGTLQVTPDIEEEIAAVDRGETVSMSEFKTMFSRWL
jgi:hypothetical protein